MTNEHHNWQIVPLRHVPTPEFRAPFDAACTAYSGPEQRHCASFRLSDDDSRSRRATTRDTAPRLVVAA